jgi:hypothetical protein
MTIEGVLPAPAIRLSRPAAWFALMGIFVMLFMLQGLRIGPGQDQSIFMVLGRGILQGSTPYLDLWDHKPPVIYLITAIADLMPGDYWGWLWGFSIAAVTGTGYLVWLMTNRVTAVIATVLLASYPATAGGGLTETFATLAAAAAFWWATRQRWLLAGAAAGIALLTSLQLLALAPALLVLGWRRGLLPGMAGVALAVVPLLLWLGLAGALPAAWDAVIVYSRAYVDLSPTQDIPRYLPFVGLMLAPLLPLALHRPRGRTEMAAMVWVGVGLLVVLANGRLFPHYLTPLLVPLAILAGRSVRHLRRRQWILAAVLLTTAGWGVLLAPAPYR